MSCFKYRLGILLTAVLLLTACASPEERFAKAAAREGTVTDPEVLKCAGAKLKTQLGAEKFDKLIEELELIGAKKKSAADADLKLMGAMTVATGACAVSGALDGIMGGGKKGE